MEKGVSLLTIGMILIILVMVLPEVGAVITFILTGAVTLYNAAVAGGLYKEPLLAEFRKYGEESAVYPLCNALLAGGVCCLSLTAVLPQLIASRSYLARLIPDTIINVLGLTLLSAGGFSYLQPTLRTSLPRWYTNLIRHATRQERRQIGWAWVRLPLRMRMRLNGDNKAFEVWVQLVRLTVVYGAYDPDSPWHRWT